MGEIAESEEIDMRKNRKELTMLLISADLLDVALNISSRTYQVDEDKGAYGTTRGNHTIINFTRAENTEKSSAFAMDKAKALENLLDNAEIKYTNLEWEKPMRFIYYINTDQPEYRAKIEKYTKKLEDEKSMNSHKK